MNNNYLKGGTALLNAPEIVRRLGLHEGAVVADLGCGGSGHFIIPLAVAVGEKGRVFCVDVQYFVLETLKSKAAHHKLLNIQALHSNLEQYNATGIADKSCDMVLVINVLFQNKDHETIVREAIRMLKNGGRLVVIDWKKTASPLGPPLELRVDTKELLAIIKKLGLDEYEEFDPGLYHFSFIFKNP